MKKNLRQSTIFSLFLIIFLPIFAFAGDWNTNKNGVVLNGYDVVAYRTEDKAIKGSSNISATYDGVIFHFATQKNKVLFMKSPKKHIPKYNGYCAFAVGQNNAKVPANADTFKIYNGELLVFFNDLYKGNKFNTKVPWNNKEKSLFAQAEQNWIKLK